MLAHTVLLSVGAFAAVVAAAPALESRATSYVFHYNTGNVPVACSGINTPSNGIYAAVQDGNTAGAACGSLLTITNVESGVTVNDVLVTGTFPNCDSIACGPAVARVSDTLFSTFESDSGVTAFQGSWSVQA